MSDYPVELVSGKEEEKERQRRIQRETKTEINIVREKAGEKRREKWRVGAGENRER